jgi:hypothetical protein
MNEKSKLYEHLENAYAELVTARKEAILTKSEAYEEIGDALECIEAAFIWVKQ